MSEASDRKTYKNLYLEIGKPELGTWGHLALDHWKKFLPRWHAYLTKLGCLTEAAAIAEHHAKSQYGLMVEQGTNPYAAKEIAMKENILLDGEDEQTEMLPSQMKKALLQKSQPPKTTSSKMPPRTT